MNRNVKTQYYFTFDISFTGSKLCNMKGHLFTLAQLLKFGVFAEMQS